MPFPARPTPLRYSCAARLFSPAVVLAATLSLAASAAFAQSRSGMGAPAVEVKTVRVEPASDPVTFSGTVEAIDNVDIIARVQGFLMETRFKAGATVDAGDVLFKIETAPFDAAVLSTEAKLAQARAQRKNAELQLDRQRTLTERNVTAQARLDEVQAQASIAEADVQAAQAEVERARIELAYTTIRAPFSGKISRAFFSHGALVGPQSGPLARLVSLNPLRVVFSIPDSLLVDARLAAEDGQETDPKSLDFRIRLSNGRAYSGEGHVEYVANETDSATGAVPVRLIFKNPGMVLVPGQLVQVLVGESDPPRLPVAPQTSVLRDRQGRYVYVVGDDNVVNERRIETGPQLDAGWAVTDGLKEGERVVVQGVQKIRDGATVQVGDGEDEGREGGADGEQGGAGKAPAAASDQNWGVS